MTHEQESRRHGEVNCEKNISSDTEVIYLIPNTRGRGVKHVGKLPDREITTHSLNF